MKYSERNNSDIDGDDIATGIRNRRRMCISESYCCLEFFEKKKLIS